MDRRNFLNIGVGLSLTSLIPQGSFGHNKNNFTFPIGINAKLDADKKIIKLMEQAVM